MLKDSSWIHGHKLASRGRKLPPEEKERFYGVNKFVRLAHEEFSPWALEVEESTQFKGRWRETLGLLPTSPLILEIGTGNGYYFEHLARSHKDAGLVGIELKYKPLIQTVKRTLLTGHRNFRALRYDAKHVDDIFASGELNDVFVFFPDPWEKRRENKHRLIDLTFLKALHDLQKPGSKLEIKTDSESYFHWICERLPKSPYKVLAQEMDLHISKWAESNFQTHFERLWTQKGRKTFYLRLSSNP